MADTARKFAQTDNEFHRACELANIKPTRRQASKFLREQGLAFKALRFAQQNPDHENIEEALEFAGLRRIA